MRVKTPVRASHVDREIYIFNPEFSDGEVGADCALCDMCMVMYGDIDFGDVIYGPYAAMIAAPDNISTIRWYW